MVRIEKTYRFETDDGPTTLADLFRGALAVVRLPLRFGPDYGAGCPSCSFIADGFNGFEVHLAQMTVMLWVVSRAPLPKLTAYKQRLGWTFPWASSFGGDLNADPGVGFTAEEEIDHNYRREPKRDRAASGGGGGGATGHAAMCGVDTPTYLREMPGMSAFVIEEGLVLTRTRPTRAASMGCGAPTNGSIARQGRNEQGPRWKRRDEYPR